MHEHENKKGDSNQYRPRDIFSSGSDDEAISDEADVIFLPLSLSHNFFFQIVSHAFLQIFLVDSLWTLVLGSQTSVRKLSALYMK